MRFTESIRSAWRATWATRTASALIAFLVAAMCASVIATVGRSTAAQRDVLARWEQAGARTLIIGSPERSGLLSPAVLTQTSHLSVVERVVGTVSPQDVTNAAVGPGGASVPSWTLLDDPGDAVELTSGRWPRPGEALVSTPAQQALGMDATLWGREPCHDEGVDRMAGRRAVPRTRPLRRSLGRGRHRRLPRPGGIQPPHRRHHPGRRCLGDGRRRAAHRCTAGIRPQHHSAPEPRGTPQRGLVGSRCVRSDPVVVGSGSRGAPRRRGHLGGRPGPPHGSGRRRALGATRATIVALVVLRAGFAATAGVLVGTAAGLVIAGQLGVAVPADFAVGVGVLALMTSVTAAVPPAFYAATRDPVRVLRTP